MFISTDNVANNKVANQQQSFKLKKSSRLLKPNDFQAVIKGRHLIRGALFAVHSFKIPGTSCDRARLGLVIGKKNAPLSVTRNHLKRVIREAFRKKRLALPHNDYVCRLQTRVPDVSLRTLKQMAEQDINRLFDKIITNVKKAPPPQ